MKKLVSVILATGLIFAATGCNRQIADLTYEYNYAYISLPNGDCIEGEVQSWLDYDDGDQIQVKINDITYLTDTTRVVLANK